jgi:hypothetical protein
MFFPFDIGRDFLFETSPPNASPPNAFKKKGLPAIIRDFPNETPPTNVAGDSA